MAHYTLETFNAQQAAMYQRLALAHRTHPNNIACPKCGAELWDELPLAHINPASIDPENPPQQLIACHACDFTGTRLA